MAPFTHFLLLVWSWKNLSLWFCEFDWQKGTQQIIKFFCWLLITFGFWPVNPSMQHTVYSLTSLWNGTIVYTDSSTHSSLIVCHVKLHASGPELHRFERWQNVCCRCHSGHKMWKVWIVKLQASMYVFTDSDGYGTSFTYFAPARKHNFNKF